MNVVIHRSSAEYEVEYQAVRAALISRGSSLNKWLAQNGVSRQLAYRALKGQSLGRKAVKLRVKIISECLGS